LLFVGRLHGVKGLEYLLPAIDLLKRDGKLSFKLLVVGEGPLREWIEKYVEKNGLLDNVFIAGAQPHSAMQFWYAAADGFCLPSKAEGLPNVIIESLALGIPVVASDVGGIPDLVNEKNGYLVDAGDVKGLAYAIESMMNRNWTKDEVMSACQFLSWEEAANRYIDIYESLIDAGGV
jgi:glycosyltransferase involved in cell wall biosynthesis